MLRAGFDECLCILCSALEAACAALFVSQLACAKVAIECAATWCEVVLVPHDIVAFRSHARHIHGRMVSVDGTANEKQP